MGVRLIGAGLIKFAEIFRGGGSFLGQALAKVEPNKLKWVMKFIQERNLTHPYNYARESSLEIAHRLLILMIKVLIHCFDAFILFLLKFYYDSQVFLFSCFCTDTILHPNL